MDALTQALPFDAARLHELHLASLGGDGQTMVPAMQLALQANFGSFERWRDAFLAMGHAPGAGSGWLLLVFQPHDGTLVNRRAADATQVPAGDAPILALDMHVHAAAAATHVDGFVAHIDWAAVYARYQVAVYAASEPFAAAQDDVPGALLLDVRRAGVYAQSRTMIPGARWCDPAAVGTWSRELPADRELVVYCIYGHEVGRATALRLRAAGLKARYLDGGIDGWQKAGRPLEPKTDAS
jgi:Fe-Mn family superoxide dismutase